MHIWTYLWIYIYIGPLVSDQRGGFSGGGFVGSADTPKEQGSASEWVAARGLDRGGFSGGGFDWGEVMEVEDEGEEGKGDRE